MSDQADIRLEEKQVVVDAWDFCLDSSDPDRRQNDTPHRRALVHDYDDGLTVNWDNDYPGGVTMLGTRKISSQTGKPIAIDGSVSLQNSVDFKAGFRIISGPLSWTYFRTDDGQRLVVDSQGMQNSGVVFKGPVSFEGPVKLQKFYGGDGHGAVITLEDLAHEIVKLQNEVGELKQRIAALES